MPRCCYEVLGVERDASDTEIKKSYRRLALKWHPDKNTDNSEESTRVFTEIQQAYEVLIDPQERAWYDKHREQIIRGGDDYVDNSINLMKYFSASVYCGFGDDEQGFYAVYTNVFKIITKEDAEFADGQDLDVPEFGTSTSDYEEVVQPFYAYWQSYSTLKSYVWLEKYDIREAPNRRVQRLMEKDNKKIRDAVKKERNEEVRALVKFVRKRDKRVKAYLELLREKDEERKRITEQKRLEALREREKMLKAYKEESWASLSGLEEDLVQMNVHLDSEFGRDNDIIDSQSDEEEVQQYYCVACDKAFKTEKALVNHEKSRKHKDKVAAIKREMADSEDIDELALLNGENGVNEYYDTRTESEYFSKRQHSVDETGTDFVSVGELDLMDSVDLSTMRIKGNNRYKVKVLHERKRALSGIGEGDLEGGGEEVEANNEESNGNEAKSGEREAHENIGNEKSEENVNEDDSRESLSNATTTTTTDIDNQETEDEKENLESQESGGDRQTTGAVTEKRKPKEGNKNSPQASKEPSANFFKCNVCQGSFPTRNKMFQHIKELGHALKLDTNREADDSQRQGKKKNKKKR
ncbi:dnaJ homolog subfamily C member 21-like [Stylophora pistillata]|uniref:dnaJ homolog subfamily C member 21-like n=1 Tax=Stylophora pistillata TaxID=50429 RepID=UPI000C053A5E|nr:dnaJ homolog subfamily C member 21-like [Stylophora pistillata]